MSFPVTLEGKSAQIFKDRGTDSRGRMLGTTLTFPDGRRYKWAKAGGAIAIGRVVGMASQSAYLVKDNIVAATAARTTAEWDAGTHTAIVATTASASTSVHIYANRFDDGYLWVNDEAGEGQILQIKSHGVSASAGDTSVTITMYDEEILTIALTTASQMGLVANVYKDVVTHTGTTGGGPAVGVAPVAVDSGDYFWLQTWGLCPVMVGPDTLISGHPAAAGITTGTSTGLAFVAGSVYPQNTTMATADYLLPTVGRVYAVGTGDAEYALIFLNVSP